VLRNRFAACVALAAFAVLGIAGPVPAGEQVPFKGRLEGVVVISPVPGGPPTLVDVLVTATGNATHLGKFEITVPHRVDRSTTPPSAAGFYYFTAANGDTLSASFTGQATPTATPGVLAIVETATITGGTGRFAGASGGFTCERFFDTTTDETFGSFEGTISRGKDKK
jgi:hypothetical protein